MGEGNDMPGRVCDFRRHLVFGLLCVLFLPALSSCGRNAPQDDKLVKLMPQEEAVTYSFATVERTDIEKTARVRCTYRQTNGEDIRFLVGGKEIGKVYVKEGEEVEKGQLLCELKTEGLARDIEDLEYQIARNELLLGYVDADETNAVSGYWVNYLFHTKMSESDAERLEASIEAAKQSYRYKREDLSDALELQKKKLALLKQQLAESRVYAGMDGIVYRLKANLEGTISVKDVVIMSILDAEEGIFEAGAENYSGFFKEGDILTLTVSYGTAKGQYEVTPWDMDAWGEKQYFKLVSLPEDKSISVGTNGNISMVADTRKNVLSLPLNAIKLADDKNYVYVLGEDNMREVRWIETGLYGDERVEILSGLTEGERVILK